MSGSDCSQLLHLNFDLGDSVSALAVSPLSNGWAMGRLKHQDPKGAPDADSNPDHNTWFGVV